jgi:hypothetical protein
MFGPNKSGNPGPAVRGNSSGNTENAVLCIVGREKRVALINRVFQKQKLLKMLIRLFDKKIKAFFYISELLGTIFFFTRQQKPK